MRGLDAAAAPAPRSAPVVEECSSDRLSMFRTQHRFLRYGEFSSVEGFLAYRDWAAAQQVPLYILGNGSNTLFVHRTVRTLVLRNRLEAWMRNLGEGRVEASSSLPIIAILKHCETHALDSFYFLASVPAQVGGALAMNAGGGTGPTILDFVESVTFMERGQRATLRGDEIWRKHRQTMFTGVHDRLIVSAVFCFPARLIEQSEIRKRINWCHEHQDLSAPNCGSVFRVYHAPILRRFRGLPPWGIRWPVLRAQFSRKVNNWIICKSGRSWSVVLLIRMVQLVHRLFGKHAIPEVIEVD